MVHGSRNYRGRRSKGKIVLAAMLILVILASLTFLFLQERVLFFDETGTPYFRMPGQTEQGETLPKEDIDLTIQPAEPEEVKTEPAPEIQGFQVSAPLTAEAWTAACDRAEELLGEDCGAVAVTLKDGRGNVYFDSAVALPGTVQPEEEATLAAVLDSGLYTIARIACFHDPKAANRETETMGLQNTGGYIFYDGNNSQWLDPAKEEARVYLCAIAEEAARMGFDEILLTDVSYPTEGKLDKIDYGEADRAEMLRRFLLEVRAVLEPYGVKLSVEVPEEVVLAGIHEAAGLELRDVAALADHVCAVTAPERAETLTSRCENFVAEVKSVPEGLEGSFLLL